MPNFVLCMDANSIYQFCVLIFVNVELIYIMLQLYVTIRRLSLMLATCEPIHELSNTICNTALYVHHL